MAEGYLKKMAESGYNVSSISYFHKVMIPYLLERYQIGKHEIVADLGAGRGHCLIPLYEKGWKNLIAVDIDDYNFELFKEKYGIKCYKVDLETESIPVETPRIIIHTTKKVCLDYLGCMILKRFRLNPGEPNGAWESSKHTGGLSGRHF